MINAAKCQSHVNDFYDQYFRLKRGVLQAFQLSHYFFPGLLLYLSYMKYAS